ncbi:MULTISPECIES: YceI family protein [unclassified Streptomyces]|uniref:YceI family protein n=1 Tax=unclassified Streptomyces TaxID=2593676 RepID=UPI003D750282
MDATGDAARAIPRLGRYSIDTSSSTVSFSGRHFLGLLPVRGTLALRGGTVDVAEPLAESVVRAEIDAASFRTGDARRDGAVRSARFLDTGRHPVITFESEAVDTSSVSGTLTVRGTARPALLTVVAVRVLPESFAVRATARVDRTGFGVTAARAMAGRFWDLTLEVACVRR